MADLETLLEKSDGILRGNPGKEYLAILDDLQGNILQSHGRGHSRFLFIRFKREAGAIESARNWIRSLAVTSEREENESGRKGLFTSLLLSSAGYRALGTPVLPDDPAFLQGMKNRARVLRDKPYEWDPEYGKNDFHALVLLAHRVSGELEIASQSLRNGLSSHFTESIKEESGNAISVEGPDGPHYIEPFGFRDGISQPLFYQEEIGRKEESELFGVPQAPLNTLLLKDPHGGPASCGTFFVFRKLRQNVVGFYQEAERLRSTLPGSVDEETMLAQLMGRYRDGTPLTAKAIAMKNDGDGKSTSFNNFDYQNDPPGENYAISPACPFHSHTRKANPRLKSKVLIARRGIPYGPKLDRDPSGRPAIIDGKLSKGGNPIEEEVGVLFMCAQRDIEKQFETIQGRWLNPEYNVTQDGSPPGGYGGPKGGTDPIGGHPLNQALSSGLAFFDNFKFAETVDVKGGEYFFAPSLTGLKAI